MNNDLFEHLLRDDTCDRYPDRLRYGGGRSGRPFDDVNTELNMVPSAIAVREVTDKEVTHYEEHGWVKLNEFISPAFASELLTAARKLENEAKNNPDPGKPEDHPDARYRERPMGKPRQGYFQTSTRVLETERYAANWWGFGEVLSLDPKVEPFVSFGRNKMLGRAALKLMNLGRYTDNQIVLRSSRIPQLLTKPLSLVRLRGPGLDGRHNPA